MDYICEECGHLFDRDEISTWREAHGERLSGCPRCGGGFAEAKPCALCGGGFREEELHGDRGVCRECLIDSMNPVKLVDYMRDNRMEWDFYTEHLFSREAAVLWLRRGFFRRLVEEREAGLKTALTACVDFVADDGAGLEDYATWLTRGERNG